jgi:hypothetical protein
MDASGWESAKTTLAVDSTGPSKMKSSEPKRSTVLGTFCVWERAIQTLMAS